MIKEFESSAPVETPLGQVDLLQFDIGEETVIIPISPIIEEAEELEIEAEIPPPPPPPPVFEAKSPRSKAFKRRTSIVRVVKSPTRDQVCV
jgi:hypothetical protein